MFKIGIIYNDVKFIVCCIINELKDKLKVYGYDVYFVIGVEGILGYFNLECFVCYIFID